MTTALYDGIGESYRATRRPDARITAALVELLDLPPGSRLCDIGAGCGNYSNALADQGYSVVAVEPSRVMREQAVPRPCVEWLAGMAEALPLPDASVDGLVCTLASHHFSSLTDAAGEMNRICPNGPIVFFTFDPEVGAKTWFAEYFPEIQAKDRLLFPYQQDFTDLIAEATGRTNLVRQFPLPHDLADRFMYAPWRYPEAYLDENFRANTSGFASADQAIVADRLARLRADLESGLWDERYGELRHRDRLDAGFYFAVFR